MKTPSLRALLGALSLLLALGITGTASAAKPQQQIKQHKDYLPIQWTGGLPAAISTGDLNYRLGVGVVYWVMEVTPALHQTILSAHWSPCSGRTVSNDFSNVIDTNQAWPFDSIRTLLETGVHSFGTSSFKLEPLAVSPSLISSLCKSARREPDSEEILVGSGKGSDETQLLIHLITGRSSVQNDRLAVWLHTDRILREPIHDSNGLAVYRNGSPVLSDTFTTKDSHKDREILDCVQRTYVVTDFVDLDVKGNVQSHVSDPAESQGIRTIPDTVGDGTLTAVCTIYGLIPP